MIHGWILKWVPLFLCLMYWATLWVLGGLHLQQILVSLTPTVLYYMGPRTRPLFNFLLPFFLSLMVYDSQRFYDDLIRGPIHVREPYEFDIALFGITVDDQKLTPTQWLQFHTHPVLDFISGLYYILFVPIFLLIAAYFKFVLSRTGTLKHSAQYISDNALQIMWAFLWLNILGFSTYYWYAASPPWFASLYGFNPVTFDVPSIAAGCSRFDQLIGFPLFEKFYGNAIDVHGAIPSLHIAYPLLTVFYAFKFGALRITSLVFYLGMCFSALYVNHHYVLDIIWGSVYAVLVAMITNWAWQKRLQRSQLGN